MHRDEDESNSGSVGRARTRTLLLASDGSPGAFRAAAVAAEFAAALDAQVIVASVATSHGAPLLPWDAETEERPIPKATAAEWAHTGALRLGSQGIDVTEVVLAGHPADALIAQAARCAASAIILGRHGATHEQSPSAGSVVDELVRRSPCPLLVVP